RSCSSSSSCAARWRPRRCGPPRRSRGPPTPGCCAGRCPAWRRHSRSRSRSVRTGILWSLAALTRPEATFLLVLWGVCLLVDARSRDGIHRLVFGSLGPVILYGGWLLFARIYYGSFWPQTLAAKSAGGVGLAYHA